MVIRRFYVMLPLLALLLTGCFRQASDPVETVVEAPGQVQTGENGLPQAAATATTAATATPGIAVITSTSVVPVTSTNTPAPTNTTAA
ncbi:MAG: hypothetical protein ACOCX3_04125, partial [Chloroflexota bacterium]